ncbi:hypothetical protein HDU83_001847 [Entophlyctis luteolus]|nr:hypothetical protein HDU82_002053 [Entophlyctis luteolus]KAJ3347739.1 hypothetical protein HDU83_001847 [Entophlyctis luteolus]
MSSSTVDVHEAALAEPKALMTATTAGQDASSALSSRLVPFQTASEFVAHMQSEVKADQCFVPMLLACFMTGFTSVASFSACYIWCGFQTGNLAQLGLAVARTFQADESHAFLLPDRQALTSLGAFLLGTMMGRVGDRFGAARRAWLAFATVLQALLLAIAAGCIRAADEPDVASSRGVPSWTSAPAFLGLAFASASLGLQGIVSKRLNTQFGTTLVLTTIWVELLNDPKLFVWGRVKTRDHRLLAVLFLFVGAFIGRALIESPVGTFGTLLIGAAFRALTATVWTFI